MLLVLPKTQFTTYLASYGWNLAVLLGLLVLMIAPSVFAADHDPINEQLITFD
jgi:hypothetical protein